MILSKISQTFEEKKTEIESFFKEKSQGLIPPLYLSCDIRNSGHKLGIIDTNLFPAGFNNLCNAFSHEATHAFKNYFSTYYPKAQRLILLCEEHTRNRFYLENLSRIKSLITEAGLEIKIAYLGQNIKEDFLKVPLDKNQNLDLEKLSIENGIPYLKNFEADLVISNNDFSSGIPESILTIQDKIIPSPQLGWQQRRKSTHFQLLDKLIQEFSQYIGLDPWLLRCLHANVQKVDLSSPEDLENIAQKIEMTLDEIQKNYQRHHITDKPYVFLKSDSGTYGMGLLDVYHPDEIRLINRKTRNKLLSSKGGQKTRSFLIQEGIPTADHYSGLPIEPVIYMVGFKTVGGFFRMNAEKDTYTSLNAKGMVFSCLCLHKIDEPHEDYFLNCAEKKNLVNLSMTMARLAAITAAQEQKQFLKY